MDKKREMKDRHEKETREWGLLLIKNNTYGNAIITCLLFLLILYQL